MRRFQFIRRALATVALALLAPQASAQTAPVCRAAAHVGMVGRVQRIKALLGPDVTELGKIKVFVSRAGDQLYLQSNYLSRVSGGPGRHAFPTKIRIAGDRLADLEEAMLNIVYDAPPDAAQAAAVRAAMDRMTFLLDPSALDAAGRPPIDLGAAKRLRLASDAAILSHGELRQATLNRPPPAVLEVLSGCCFLGRPPGQTVAMRARLEGRTVTPATTRVFSMVVDSATSDVIAGSTALSRLAAAPPPRGGDWGAAFGAALTASRGKTLVVLSHVEGGRVVVRDAAGKALYAAPLEQLHARARAAGVQLVLIGCETIRSAEADGIPVAIVGKYNTVDAARRIADALAERRDAFGFLSALASERLTVVAQKGAWDPQAVGAGLYEPRPGAPARWVRALRVWWMGVRHG